MATRDDYLEDCTDKTAGSMNSKVNFEIRRLRRWGLNEDEILQTLTEAVEWIFFHEENPYDKEGK